jgi:osmotically-inducible protein OsmY
MRKLLLLCVIGATAVGAYNYSNGRDLFSLPGISAGALKHTVRETVGETVRDGVRSAARQTSAEFKDRAEEAVTSASLTSKIKAKMALDDLVNASDVDVDTDGSVVTLAGTVGSKDQQRRAVRIATETAGVTKVVNHLRVR